ncbi:hypothetical protein ACFQAT_15095 [Undibacterium arcticum]|uniref:hypothetical protein n=1 Tax=Undibacterium arcticum TaxID=1762892 RepID=UPI00361AC53B
MTGEVHSLKALFLRLATHGQAAQIDARKPQPVNSLPDYGFGCCIDEVPANQCTGKENNQADNVLVIARQEANCHWLAIGAMIQLPLLHNYSDGVMEYIALYRIAGVHGNGIDCKFATCPGRSTSSFNNGGNMDKRISKQLAALVLGAGMLVPGMVRSVDGVMLIDPNRAPSTSPGFLVIISEPGNYRLAGSVTVPDADTTAIEINADNVTIDLNGFDSRPGALFAAARILFANGDR